MLYLFTGDDTKNKNLNYEKFIKSFPSAIPIFPINRNNFIKDQIESFYSGSSLFFLKCIVVFDGILDRQENSDFILSKLEKMSESPSVFIFKEHLLNKSILDIYKKHNSEMNIFLLPKEKKERFNSFLLANAFSDKDKLNLWIYFRQAVSFDVSPEELVGVLFWKIKDMIVKKDFRKFKEFELKNLASSLSLLLSESRIKGTDTQIALEQFLLEVF